MMLGSSCSPCCSSCTLPAEIPASFSWNLSSVGSYKWYPRTDLNGGYTECENTAMIGSYSTPNKLFSNSAFDSVSFTLTQPSPPSAGDVQTYNYASSVTLSGCCDSAMWSDWVSRFPTWYLDSPTWKHLAISQVTIEYTGQMTFYAKEYSTLASSFSSAISVIQARGDTLPGTPCGLARGLASMFVRVKYDNGECKAYYVDFQLKGQATDRDVPYPEDPQPWPSGPHSTGAAPRYVAYGIQRGSVWLSSPLELQFSASSVSSDIDSGGYLYVSNANRLAVA